MTVTLKAPQLADFNFSASATSRQVMVAAGSGPTVVPVNDANISRTITDLVENAFDLSLTLVAGSQQMLDQAVLTATNGTVSGLTVSRVANGACRVFIRTKWLDKFVDVTFSRTGGVITDVFQNYLNGTLGKHITDEMTAAANAGGTKPLFTTLDHSTPNYVRNADCWIDADWTGRPVWNTAGGGLFGGVAVSPRHLITATHASPSGTIRFFASDNSIVERTITGQINIGGDLSVAVMNADLPSTVKWYKVLPANWQNYIKTFSLPVIGTDQEQKCLARRWYASGNRAIAAQPYTSGVFANLSEEIIGGDSGSANFILLNGELIVTGTHYTSQGHPMVSNYTSEVNAAMTTLGGGYQLTPVDLTGFNTYG